MPDTEFVDESDDYKSEINIECYQNAHLIYIMDYIICLYQEVTDVIIKKKKWKELSSVF